MATTKKVTELVGDIQGALSNVNVQYSQAVCNLANLIRVYDAASDVSGDYVVENTKVVLENVIASTERHLITLKSICDRIKQ